MPRQKRSSAILNFAEGRLVAIEAIDITLNLGDDLNVESIKQSIEETRETVRSYNAALTEVDQLKESVQERERSLEELIDRMSSAIAAKYGRSSQQYRAVISVRRKNRRAKAKTQTTQPETKPATLSA